MTIATTVKRCLEKNAIEYSLLSHPHTGSSHETADAAHVSEDHIAKGVMVRDEKGYAMVVIPGNHWLEMDHLKKELNRDFQLASEDEISRLFTDCETGAIPPLGPAYGIETFLDQALMSLANIYFESGNHAELVHTRGKDFNSLLKGVRHGFFSHNR